MTESTAVAVLPPKEKALDVYSKVGGLDPYLDQIRDEVDEFKKNPPKLTTATGRAEYRSFAYKVSRMKTALEDMGKDLSAEAKALPKKIDAERKRSWDILESWQGEILEPVLQWDAEQKRLEEIRLAEEAAKALAIQIESDHEIALLMYAEHKRKLAEAEKEAADRKAAEDLRVATKAAELATKQAEEKAQAAILAAQAAEANAKREKAELEAAAIKAKQDAEEAAKQAAAKAEQDRLDAIENERKRVAAQAAKEKAEEEARAKNKANQKRVNNEVLQDIIAAGCSEDCGKLIIAAIARGQVRNTKINY